MTIIMFFGRDRLRICIKFNSLLAHTIAIKVVNTYESFSFILQSIRKKEKQSDAFLRRTVAKK